VWSDSIFDSQDRAKLNYLARCMSAMYAGGRAYLETVAGSPVTSLATDAAVPAFVFTHEGEKICLIAGTMSADEYAPQLAGWMFPFWHTTGAFNANYWELSLPVYNAMPNDVRLICGHSKGGAVASFVGRRAKIAGLNPRVIGIGTPNFVSLAARNISGWPTIIHFHSPLDVVRYMPNSGFAGLDWRRAGQEYLIAPYGITPVASTPLGIGETTSVAAAVGDAYHAIASYVGLTSTPLVSVPVVSLPGSTGMPQILQVRIAGSIHEQRISNVLYYAKTVGEGNASLSAFAEKMRSMWRVWIVPKTSANYTALSYDVRQIGAPIWKNMTDITQGSLWRYDAQTILPGNLAGDTGPGGSGTCFPSFVAVGCSKKGGHLRRASNDVVVAGAVPPTGGIRIAGILESITQGSGDNRLIPSWQNDFQDAFDQLSEFDADGKTFTMCMVTLNANGSPLQTGDPPQPDYAYSLVQGVAINPYLTSQISRKQSIHRLG